jgi:hypothetical protein
MQIAVILLQSQPDQEQIMHMMALMVPLISILMLIGLAVVMVPCWFILKKAGFSPWLTLLNLVPLGNLILLYIVAFSQWKVMPIPQYPGQPPYPPQYPPVYPPQA